MQAVLGEVAAERPQPDRGNAGLEDRVADIARCMQRIDVRRLSGDPQDGVGDDAIKRIVGAGLGAGDARHELETGGCSLQPWIVRRSALTAVSIAPDLGQVSGGGKDRNRPERPGRNAREDVAAAGGDMDTRTIGRAADRLLQGRMAHTVAAPGIERLQRTMDQPDLVERIDGTMREGGVADLVRIGRAAIDGDRGTRPGRRRKP